MANPVVGLDIDLKVGEALAELKRLGPGAEAEGKAIAKALGTAMRDAEKAAKKLADEANKAASGTKNLGDAAGKTGQASSKLAGALGLVSPAAAGAARDLADLADVAEVADEVGAALGISTTALTAALGLAAVAVAAAYVAWRIYSEEGDRAAQVAASVSAALEAQEPILRTMRAAQLDAAEATGALTEAQARQLRQGAQLLDAYGASTKEAADKVAALHAEEGTLGRHIADVGEALESSPFGWALTTSALDAFTTSTSEAQAEVDGLMGTMSVAAAATEKTRIALNTVATETDKAKNAAKAATPVEADLTAELLKQAEAAQRVADSFAAKLAAIEADAAAADAIVARSGAFRLSEVERLQAEQESAVDDYTAKAKDGALLTADIAAGEASIRANYQDQITAATERAAAERVAIEVAAAEQVAAAQAAAMTEAVGRITEVGGYATQALGMISSAADESSAQSADMAQRLTEQLIAGEEYYTAAQEEELKVRIEAARDAATRQFNAAKAAKIAEAAISTAVGIINAISSDPPPSPFGLIGAGIVTLAGAASVATIAGTEPSFHSGYSPDEFQARVLRKESVLSPAATEAVGSGRVREINSGVTRSGGGDSPPIIFRHQVFRPFIKDFLTQPSALKSALSSGQIIGHRTNRRGTSG